MSTQSNKIRSNTYEKLEKKCLIRKIIFLLIMIRGGLNGQIGVEFAMLNHAKRCELFSPNRSYCYVRNCICVSLRKLLPHTSFKVSPHR